MGPTAQIEVGAYCSIAGGLIVLGERHPIEDVTSSVILYDYGKPHFKSMFDDFNIELPRLRHRVPAYLPPPVIEHDVWIGQNVTLSRGITLGTGSVIAGGSLVTKDVEPYTIVGGNPARKIRDRFEPKISRRLLQSAWWTLHPTQLLPLLKIRDPYTFLQEVEVAQAGGNVPVWENTPTTANDIARFVRE